MTNTEIIRETVKAAFSAEQLHSMAAAHTSAPSATAARQGRVVLPGQHKKKKEGWRQLVPHP